MNKQSPLKKVVVKYKYLLSLSINGIIDSSPIIYDDN